MLIYIKNLHQYHQRIQIIIATFYINNNNNELNKSYRQQRSISRDLIGEEEEMEIYHHHHHRHQLADIERINRAALLRYKSLDSMTYNNRKSNLNGKNNNRKRLTKSKQC